MTNLLIGKTQEGNEIALCAKMANRHGLVTGATGTGKTVTLQRLAEQFSSIGVPVFAADVKGDLSGLAAPASLSPKLSERLAKLGIDNFEGKPNPVILWDVFGTRGHPVRATISEMGPLLLSRILQLNDTQTQVLQISFKIADEQGLLLLDTKDLKQLLSWIGDNLSELKNDYGNITSATLATIQRSLIVLEEAGGETFFGEPALDIRHLQQKDFSGSGAISLLDATKLLQDSRLYSTFLLWLLSELFEQLPEVGDLEKPKLVFFFDEAHLLFKDAPPPLIERIEQVVRLIRSKGIGVYFVTQNPADIPESVLAQLGNRIQHALRAYTPSEQKAVRAAAQSFRPNSKFDTEKTITQLEVGEALVSVLDIQGKPTMVEKTIIAPPQSRIGVLAAEERAEIISRSPLSGVYDNHIDRESAYEILTKRAQNSSSQPQKNPASQEDTPGFFDSIFSTPKGSKRQGMTEALFKSIVRSAGSSLGREIMRGILGSIRR